MAVICKKISIFSTWIKLLISLAQDFINYIIFVCSSFWNKEKLHYWIHLRSQTGRTLNRQPWLHQLTNWCWPWTSPHSYHQVTLISPIVVRIQGLGGLRMATCLVDFEWANADIKPISKVACKLQPT